MQKEIEMMRRAIEIIRDEMAKLEQRKSNETIPNMIPYHDKSINICVGQISGLQIAISYLEV